MVRLELSISTCGRMWRVELSMLHDLEPVTGCSSFGIDTGYSDTAPRCWHCWQVHGRLCVMPCLSVPGTQAQGPEGVWPRSAS